MRHLTTIRTAFQDIAVWKSAREVEFRVTGAIHAWWHRDRYLCGLAWDNIVAGIMSHAGPPRKVLMLGLGGGTSLRTLRFLLPQVELTAVELDSRMIELAREHMEVEATGTRIITGDAYAWLRENKETYDVVFDDVYGVSAEDVVRPELYTPELLKALRRSLAKGGVFAANLVTGPGHRQMQSAFRRFFQQHFSVVRSITTPSSLNECLCGGDLLVPWRQIQAVSETFSSVVDYSHWRELRCRALVSHFEK